MPAEAAPASADETTVSLGLTTSVAGGAEVTFPAARFEVVAGMGHDYPPQLWDQIVKLISEHALSNS